MAYKIFRFEFLSGVHFGTRDLTETANTFMADTLFSALCNEAVRHSAECLDTLLNYVRQEKLLFSDGFPFIEDTYYIPKPFLSMVTVEQDGNSGMKKAWKALNYIPLDKIGDFMAGILDPDAEGARLEALGKYSLRTLAAVRGREETTPFHLGVYQFYEGNGLYILMFYQNEEVLEFFESLLKSLALSGIGGERSSGLGRFRLGCAQVPHSAVQYLERDYTVYMALSVCLPGEHELESVLAEASYSLVKRSGFIYTQDRMQKDQKKRSMYVMKAGACFKQKFKGDVYDVSRGYGHPVYRYAKAFLMGVGK